MPIALSLPARINLLGNPSDGNEGDFAVLSAAVELRARAVITDHEAIHLAMSGEDQRSMRFARTDLPLPYDGPLDLLKAAVNRLYTFSPQFRDGLSRRGFSLHVWSEVPRQSGLGGSSLYILLALTGLRACYDLDPFQHHDYLLAELAQRIEEGELGITCGFADRYVPLFGGLNYIDYRGKLQHAAIGEEPLATVERLDDRCPVLPLVAATTGVRHHSGDVHGRMRPRYLEEFARWQQQGGAPPPMVRSMTAAWETAWRGKLALLAGDLERVGSLMNENHRLVDGMMRECGFADGAGQANNLFIECALQQGALGAKLTGAGGGGSVFALTRPGKEQSLLQAWQELARAEGMTEAQVFPLILARQGLILKNEP